MLQFHLVSVFWEDNLLESYSKWFLLATRTKRPKPCSIRVDLKLLTINSSVTGIPFPLHRSAELLVSHTSASCPETFLISVYFCAGGKNMGCTDQSLKEDYNPSSKTSCLSR